MLQTVAATSHTHVQLRSMLSSSCAHVQCNIRPLQSERVSKAVEILRTVLVFSLVFRLLPTIQVMITCSTLPPFILHIL